MFKGLDKSDFSKDLKLARSFIFAALTDKKNKEIISNYAGKEFSVFKNDLAEITVEKISPISLEIKKRKISVHFIDLAQIYNLFCLKDAVLSDFVGEIPQ